MENNELKYYTKEELSLNNGKSSSTVWIAYKGKIYDVSSSDLFEDGDHYGHLSGQDLTQEMDDAPHFDDVMENFEVVGLLIE
jgi:predicted heme/steroid binding protein